MTAKGENRCRTTCTGYKRISTLITLTFIYCSPLGYKSQQVLNFSQITNVKTIECDKNLFPIESVLVLFWSTNKDAVIVPFQCYTRGEFGAGKRTYIPADPEKVEIHIPLCYLQ